MSEHNLTIKNENFFPISPTKADYMGNSVIKSLTELKISIPEEISVAGFDNIF